MCKEKLRQKIYSIISQEVIRVKREFKYCAGCCCWCACASGYAQEVVVESPPGTVIGYVTQQYD